MKKILFLLALTWMSRVKTDGIVQKALDDRGQSSDKQCTWRSRLPYLDTALLVSGCAMLITGLFGLRKGLYRSFVDLSGASFRGKDLLRLMHGYGNGAGSFGGGLGLASYDLPFSVGQSDPTKSLTIPSIPTTTSVPTIPVPVVDNAVIAKRLKFVLKDPNSLPTLHIIENSIVALTLGQEAHSKQRLVRTCEESWQSYRERIGQQRESILNAVDKMLLKSKPYSLIQSYEWRLRKFYTWYTKKYGNTPEYFYQFDTQDSFGSSWFASGDGTGSSGSGSSGSGGGDMRRVDDASVSCINSLRDRKLEAPLTN